MRIKKLYTAQNKEAVRQITIDDNQTILEDCRHLDGTYFLIEDGIEPRNLATEIDDLTARLDTLGI